MSQKSLIGLALDGMASDGLFKLRTDRERSRVHLNELVAKIYIANLPLTVDQSTRNSIYDGIMKALK